MRSKSKIITFLSLIIILIAGCIPETAVVEKTPISTESAPVPSSVPELKPTQTPALIQSNITRECAISISAPRMEESPAGSLIVHSFEQDGLTYLLNIKNSSKKIIGRTLNEVASPDRKLLAYYDLDLKSIVVVTSTGNKILEVSDSDERLTPRHWLNNQQLLLEYRRSEWGGPYVVPSIVILDVLTGEQQEWLPDYPNLDTFFSPVGWSVLSRFLPNADQTYVVYQARDEWIQIVMWDLNTDREVARIFNGAEDSTPWWSYDGTRIVTNAPPVDEYQGVTYVNIDDNLSYVRGTDLFTVSVEGDINRLTYFSVTQFAWQSEYVWSPDDKRIAFLSQVSPADGNILDAVAELSVVDIDTGNVTNLCLPGYRLIWSPNGKYIVINQGLNEQRERNEAYIVDLENNSVWKIVENAEVMGWVIDEP